MSGRFDTPGKNTVRSLWNTPLLWYLNKKYNIKYRYLGLPGTDLIDIKLWKHMIEDVVAFEMANDGSDERKNIKELRKNLALLGVSSNTYFGSMEQVILMRTDLDGVSYKQDKVVTLYNLDFCDEITSKIKDVAGNKRLRFDVIRQILIDQHECYKLDAEQSIFVILLTTRNQINSKRFFKYLFEDSLNSATERYVKDAHRVKPLPTVKHNPLIGTHGWALKAFMYDTIICSYFPTPNITCLVFPMIKYKGIPINKDIESPMIHWMILCKFEDAELPKPKVYPTNFLVKHSLGVVDEDIVMSGEPGETISSLTDPLKILKPYEDKFF